MKNWETYLYSNHITIKQGGGGTEMLNIGWEGVQSDPPPKKIVTLPKLGLFLGRKAQEACLSILL